MKGRALQLDGLRAVSMIAICWDHWQWPLGWPRLFPYELFLFFFLVMTGWLITGSLLRQRDRGEASGKAWRGREMRVYQIRRGLRILAPYYAAILLAWVMGVPDMRHAFGWYATHLSNIHMATLPDWPASVNHFWSLSMQQQFYLVWPFVVWFMPRRLLLPAILLLIALGPFARYHADLFPPMFARPGVLTVSCLDYFGAGALLAWALHRGMSYESPALRGFSWLCLACYVAIFTGHETVTFLAQTRFLQQTFISLALCGFIAAARVGFRGPIGRFLEARPLQRIGELSYGIYLFHNLAPYFTGILAWIAVRTPLAAVARAAHSHSWLDMALHLLQISLHALFTGLLAAACWRFIERPMLRVRDTLGNST